MHFKKLELVGFKSFFDNTTLHFEPGITAVVGPNGTGKSNILDSIRWVLGEQSAKSLRGSDMQDVIFNGTDQKEAVGMAEVTLTFDNQSRFFNFDHPELAITRRLFRSGESEYLINKSPVRLKDILDLLLGTGVGAESYSIVAQGKIDLVLSSRPEDRRLVFDEASGITKYKAQKREAARKLEETEQNLLRINDIITEVKRQIGSLERQANKARKYKEAFEELKSKEIKLASLQKKQLIQEKNEIIKQLGDLELKESGLISLVKEQEARIANRQGQIKKSEENIMSVKTAILNLGNLIVRNNEEISYNKEKIADLEETQEYLDAQNKGLKDKLILDEDKLNKAKKEYADIKGIIQAKSLSLIEKETQINEIALRIKSSLANIAGAKKDILDLAMKLSAARNQVSDFSARQQIFLARKKRLEIEKAKVYEEKGITQVNLNNITQELEALKEAVSGIVFGISALKSDLETEALALTGINQEILNLEHKILSLESHKEFLEKLKTKYEDIGEAMNVVIYLDKLPAENMSGLVVKIKEQDQSRLKLSGEAKPIELDTRKIEEKLAKLQADSLALKDKKEKQEAKIRQLNDKVHSLQQDLRNQEIALANKEASRLTITEQFNKIKEEEDIIVLEISDTQREIEVLGRNIASCEGLLSKLNQENRLAQDLIVREEQSIAADNKSREELLVVITQTRTELESLDKSIGQGESTLKVFEDAFRQDTQNLANTEKQIKDAEAKKESLQQEIKDAGGKIEEFNRQTQEQNDLLAEAELKYREISEGAVNVAGQIEGGRKELDELKNKLYELQMQDKDIDYRYSAIKERMLQAYRIDLDSITEGPQDTDASLFSGEIAQLKEKLDSYGTVNLVAIEEYDELRKRYDFLLQQQNDLSSAKVSLHQAILKINRTTKLMFLEIFEKVREEFRNYFRLLFGGGDAQVFLIDEQDPLESGIEIICRPPGKKLQNVLLLSGGEKSLSAIALIFAIFKVKPSPFCILDEIDAALDEANVDRFSRMLQEFAKSSQFIVITHNKRTIANADVMYGITMEESGVSKIVSVKFAKEAPEKDKEPQVVLAN